MERTTRAWKCASLGALLWALAACGGSSSGDGGFDNVDVGGGDDVLADLAEDAAEPDVAEDTGGGDVAPDGPDTPPEVTYETHILPLFERTGCTGCHGEQVAKGDHQLHTLDALLTTGANAPVVTPCDSEGSLLLLKLRPDPPQGVQMPQGGPYYEADDLELVAAWIDAGADTVDCEAPVDPLPVVEERVFRVSSREAMLAETVRLPEDSAGASALFAMPGQHGYGYVAAGEGLWTVSRDGAVDPVETGWDGDRNLGGVTGVVEAAEGLTLVSTGIGLLYLSEERLWPSPVGDVLASPVHQMLVDADSEAVWFATERGLFQLVGDELFSIRPSEISEGTAVGAIGQGPDPEDADRQALWVSYGAEVYAVRPDSDGVMAYTFEIDFGDEVLDIEADDSGHVWVVTGRGLFLRRPAGVLGVSPWIRWVLPEAQRAIDVAVHSSGETWVLTDMALYRALDDQWRWQLALGAPATDVVGMSTGDQGRVWLTRGDLLVSLSEGQTLGVAGVSPGDVLNSFPPVTIYPSSLDAVLHVDVRVDECEAVRLVEAPFTVTGGALVWGDCLTNGAHSLEVEVAYDGFDSITGAVAFDWAEREEQITWLGHIEPMVYARSCARPGCHIDGFSPDSYEAWTEKIDTIIERTDPQTVQGRMPPNGPRLGAAERLMIQWWRDDGFLLE